MRRLLGAILALAVILDVERPSAGMKYERRGSSVAFIVNVGALGAEPGAALVRTLRDSFGFQVTALNEADARRSAIAEAMTDLFRRIQPGDQLLVYLSLPVRTDGRRYFFRPFDGDEKAPWTWLSLDDLTKWIGALPVSGALLVYPSCAPRSERPEHQEYLFDQLRTRRYGGAVDVLTFCAVGAELVGDERVLTEAHRAEFTTALVSTLEGAPTSGDPRLTTDMLARRLQASMLSVALQVRRVPEFSDPTFAFVFTGTAIASYRAQLVGAINDADRQGVLTALVAAVREKPGALAAPAAELLKELALDEQRSAELRRFAAEGLTRIDNAAAESALADLALHAPDVVVRQLALTHVTTKEDRSTVRAAIGDEAATIRETAIRSAGILKDDTAADIIAERLAVDPDQQVRLAAIQTLSVIDRPADRPRIIALLKVSEPPTIRREAATGLGRMQPTPDSTLALLDRLLKDKDDTVRTAAAYALARTYSAAPDRGALETALSGALKRGPDSVEQAAAFAFGQMGGRTAESMLRDVLRDGRRSDAVRIVAAESLGRLKCQAALPELREVAEHGSDGLRRAAVTALGAIGTPQAVAILLAKLEDPSPYVREEARRALGEVKKAPAEVYLPNVDNKSAAVRLQTVEKLGQSGDPAAVPALIGALNDDVYEVRRAAIRGLVNCRDPASVEKIVAALDAKDFRTRQGAAAVLGELHESRSLPALVARAGDSNSAVRAEVVRALGRFDDPEARKTVLAASADNDPLVRKAAAEALQGVKTPEAVERLRALAVEDPSSDVRKTAIESLRGGEVEIWTQQAR